VAGRVGGAIDLEQPVGDRRLAQPVLLVVLEAQEANDVVIAIAILFILVEINHRHCIHIETGQPLRPAVQDRFSAFDGIKEILTQTFLLGLAPLIRSRRIERFSDCWRVSCVWKVIGRVGSSRTRQVGFYLPSPFSHRPTWGEGGESG